MQEKLSLRDLKRKKLVTFPELPGGSFFGLDTEERNLNSIYLKGIKFTNDKNLWN